MHEASSIRLTRPQRHHRSPLPHLDSSDHHGLAPGALRIISRLPTFLPVLYPLDPFHPSCGSVNTCSPLFTGRACRQRSGRGRQGAEGGRHPGEMRATAVRGVHLGVVGLVGVQKRSGRSWICCRRRLSQSGRCESLAFSSESTTDIAQGGLGVKFRNEASTAALDDTVSFGYVARTSSRMPWDVHSFLEGSVALCRSSCSP